MQLSQLENTSQLLAATDMDHLSNETGLANVDLMLAYDELQLMSVYRAGIIMTFIILILGLAVNIALLHSLLTSMDRRSRLRPFLINLAVADLMVCCFTIAMELGWRLTVTWTAGDFFCRFLSFTKTLGLYLEAFVVLAMSIDRCYVVLYPLVSLRSQLNRTRIFLITAWIAAILFSVPQAIVFHVEYHPDIPDFVQCVTMNSFSSPAMERGYVVFGILAMYVIPLVIILTVSIILLWTIRSPGQSCRISGSTKETLKVEFLQSDVNENQQMLRTSRRTELSRPDEAHSSRPLRIRLNTGLQLCHTDTIIRKRARSRTLKLSMLIIIAFTLCYTPYAILITIAFLDPQDHSVHEEDSDDFTSQLTEGLLMLSLTFSTIMNPLIYGSYIIYTRKCWQDVVNHFRGRAAAAAPNSTSMV